MSIGYSSLQVQPIVLENTLEIIINILNSKYIANKYIPLSGVSHNSVKFERIFKLPTKFERQNLAIGIEYQVTLILPIDSPLLPDNKYISFIYLKDLKDVINYVTVINKGNFYGPV